MKRSISFLPKYAQDDLRDIKEKVLKALPQCEMIILFGSYARGTFVSYDEREEYGVLTSFISDYDILVLTSHFDLREAGRTLDNIDHAYYKRPDHQVPIQFINDDITKFQEDLEMCRYFYTDIKNEGIVLYNSQKYSLPRCRKFNYKEIESEARVYFSEKTEMADDFLHLAKCAYAQKKYRMASFQLHQAAENYFYALRLVFTLKNNKQHNLSKLWKSVWRFSEELHNLFNMADAEEKRLFELLKNAYIEARYNKNFLVTRRDCNFLFPKLETLKELTYEICEKQMNWYLEEFESNPKKRG